MERTTRRDWFACPRCGTHGEQWWLSTDRPLPDVRWSICSACRRITVWRGPLIVHPSATAGLLAKDAAALRDAAGAPGGEHDAASLRALWDALRLHLLEQEIAHEGRPQSGPATR